MAVLVLPIAREATTEEKMKTCTDRRHPRTTEDRKLFKESLIRARRHIISNADGKEETSNSRMGRSHWVTDICYNPSKRIQL